MTSITFFFIFIPILALVLLGINLVFAPHNPYQEKNSAFECGFTSFLGQNRTQFSISFFIFALLFLLFDLEILLVYPYLVSSYTNEAYGLFVLLLFLLALTLGFAFELGKKALTIDSRQMHKTNKNDLLTTNLVKGAGTTTTTAIATSTCLAITITYLIFYSPTLINILTSSLPFFRSELTPQPETYTTLASFYEFFFNMCRVLNHYREILQLPEPEHNPANFNVLLNELRAYVTNLSSTIEHNRDIYINLQLDGGRPAVIQQLDSIRDTLNNLAIAIEGGNYADVSANVSLVFEAFRNALFQLDQLLMYLFHPIGDFPVSMLASAHNFFF